MRNRTVVIAGATGVVGHAALEHFAENAEKVIQGTPGAIDVQMQREGGKPYAEVREPFRYYLTPDGWKQGG